MRAAADDVFADPLTRARRRRRIVVVVALGAVSFVTAAIVVLHLYFDGERQVRMHARTIDEARRRYCEVLARESTRDPFASRAAAPSEVLQHVGSLDIGGDGDPAKLVVGGNMDAIEERPLRDVCDGKVPASASAIHSELAPIFAPESRRSRSYDGVRQVLGALPRVRFLVVIAMDGTTAPLATPNASRGTRNATVSAYRLAPSPTWLGTVAVAVVVDESRTLANEDVASPASRAMQDAITRAFEPLGVTLRWTAVPR